MSRRPSEFLKVSAAALVPAAAVTLAWWRHDSQKRRDDAPLRSLRAPPLNGRQTAGYSVTIHQDADSIRRFLRDPAQLAGVLAPEISLRDAGDGRLTWICQTREGEAGLTTYTEEEAGTMIWRSDTGTAEVQLRLRCAPADRGTEVHAAVTWQSGGLPALMPHLLKTTLPGPAETCRKTLRRLKMLLETGEIATSSRRRAG